MDIYTAIKKEKSSLKRFIIFMLILAITLPAVLLITNLLNVFYLIYLTLIEFLIVISILIKLNGYNVEYKCNNNRLMFKIGILATTSLILCDKVVLVHTNKSDYDMEIIIITSVSFKNSLLRPVPPNFLKRHPKLKKEYEKIQEKNPNKTYYFQIVRKGGLKKYLLLDCIYRNCVKAIYTEYSIQNIKIARGQTIV
ncbi:hypothetical protein ACTFIN_15975 [Clostridium cagae]|uniref:hypothetical protein n=1 Tax=Clostridium TaxID=1485 RepID=UPI0005031502|nr:hypothetical protein [Clostridium sp. M14]KAI3344783.1 hypothetical protein CIT17_15925 [Clostridium botulinum]KFX54367.1 hypothetical protein KU40_16540 [Clostridium botulinum]KFX58494.1 hypothetical protein KU41_04545 [Clostridium botulinum]KON13241.1 hypothetical protein ACP50_15205 [Clostridium botulinum]MBY6780507.1 hypothetical protein [Clostridium botulinum]